MSYLTDAELQGMGFKKLGKGVKISDKASIYDAAKIDVLFAKILLEFHC